MTNKRVLITGGATGLGWLRQTRSLGSEQNHSGGRRIDRINESVAAIAARGVALKRCLGCLGHSIAHALETIQENGRIDD